MAVAKKNGSRRSSVAKSGVTDRRDSKSVRASDSPLLILARELRSWTDYVLGMASTAADMSLNVAKLNLRKPEQKEAVEKTGALLRHMREAAGMSLRDLGTAINLRDPGLLEAVEGGKAALPFELILRLAAVLGKNDPIPLVMNLTRAYNPGLWKTLENLGVGRLVVQAGRERELANIYRASDAARRLSDEEFAAMLAFLQSAFDMAMSFRGEGKRRRSTDGG